MYGYKTFPTYAADVFQYKMCIGNTLTSLLAYQMLILHLIIDFIKVHSEMNETNWFSKIMILFCKYHIREIIVSN